MGILMFVGIIMSISVLVDWITQLIAHTNITFISATTIALAIYFMWWVIGAGGILC